MFSKAIATVNRGFDPGAENLMGYALAISS
jgi:hypothetical protein